MMRYCNGQDPNLIRYVTSTTKEPCQCGNHFEDVTHMVIWPHLPVGPKPTPEQIDALYDQLVAEGKIRP